MSAADDPMPVFVLKAKDNVAPGGVEDYIGRLEEHGWPDHEHVPAGQPGSGSETA